MSYSPMAFNTATAGRAGFVRLGAGIGGNSDGTILLDASSNSTFNTVTVQKTSSMTSGTTGLTYDLANFTQNTWDTKALGLKFQHVSESNGTGNSTSTYHIIQRIVDDGSPASEKQGFIKFRDSTSNLHAIAKHPIAFGDGTTGDMVAVDYYGRLHVGIGLGGVTPNNTINIVNSSPTIGFYDGSSGLSGSSLYSKIDGNGGNLLFSADIMGAAAGSSIGFSVDGTTSLSVDSTSTTVTGNAYVSGSIYSGGTIVPNNFVNWTSWTPTASGLGLGSISKAFYSRVGNVVHFYVQLSSDAGTNGNFTLPFTATDWHCGTWIYRIASKAYPDSHGAWQIPSSNTLYFDTLSASSAGAGEIFVFSGTFRV